jgi:hypothetical protein
MTREQKSKHKASQTSGKDATQAAQTKSSQQETIVASQQQDSTPASLVPTWPVWPTSKPGPRSTPPPPAMHSFNVFRPEQYSEVGYNQETGEPGSLSPLRSLPPASMKDQVSFDQQPAAQNALSKRKKRL